MFSIVIIIYTCCLHYDSSYIMHSQKGPIHTYKQRLTETHVHISHVQVKKTMKINKRGPVCY